MLADASEISIPNALAVHFWRADGVGDELMPQPDDRPERLAPFKRDASRPDSDGCVRSLSTTMYSFENGIEGKRHRDRHSAGS